MLPRPPSSDVEAFRAVLRASKNIVAIAGAGLSAASGIPTFRDAGGLWRSYDPMELATPEAFARDPSKVWQFYHYRREVVLKAQLNAGHFALARLCDPTTLRTIAPNATFTLVTQNVDGLSVRALQQTITGAPRRSSDQDTDKDEDRDRDQDKASSSGVKEHEQLEKAEERVIEMHGRLLDTLCTSCGRREANTTSPICAALAGTETLDDFVDIPVERLPRCARCGGLTRPGVVWFGEVPRQLRRINEVVQAADLALIVGTSSTVFPAAGFAYEVAEHGGDVAVFNIQRSEGDRDADFLFLGPCEETLPFILFGDDADNV